ncbi:regulator of G-protein signaling 17 [Periplaneta americana]|uniref:regulator of G-protein signaling 17 n=1 Tax=Periplaneta americana TaxID=6978 RepID=UPI0037E75861
MSNASESAGGEKPNSGSGCRLRGGSTSSGNNSATPPHQNNRQQQQQQQQQQQLAPAGGQQQQQQQQPQQQQQAPLQRPSKPCCFCWCCCCSCSCLAVRSDDNPKNNLLEPNGPCDGEPTPTLEEIRSWGKSFDKLMRNSAGRKVFRDFLRCEYSEENILFWLACEELKKETNPDVVEEKARFIYEDYISILSPKEVSLDSRVREIVNRNMVDPTPHTFDEAQLQIYTLMHRDSYPRFVNSSLFKQLAQLNNNGNNGGGGSSAGTPTATQSGGRKESNA